MAAPSTREEQGAKKMEYEEDESGNNDVGHSTIDTTQGQLYKKRQQQKEANKDMLFKVYGNVIATIEEYERRLSKIEMPASAIDFPDQAWKSKKDVKANVEVQLMLFEAQKKSCLDDISDAEITDLRMKTICWASVRADKKMLVDETDTYIAKLYEILAKGTARHEMVERPRQPVLHSTMQNTLPHLMRGQQEAIAIGKIYHDDPNKKATGPNVRQSLKAEMGAKRIYDADTRLLLYLQNDCLRF